MKHPNPACQRNQEEFLKNCDPEEREFHARIFRNSNAAYLYHQLASSTDEETLKIYYEEWLEGLPPHISKDMRRLGFEACKNALSFTRYVNERNDIGMDEWLKQHLSPEDYQYKNKA